jgi:hypothetical protein
MHASFRAYVDESGDEGFAFRASPSVQASSDWFVLAAFITRKKNDLETVKIIDRVREELQRHPKKHIHWKDLKHAEKTRYAQCSWRNVQRPGTRPIWQYRAALSQGAVSNSVPAPRDAYGVRFEGGTQRSHQHMAA